MDIYNFLWGNISQSKKIRNITFFCNTLYFCLFSVILFNSEESYSEGQTLENKVVETTDKTFIEFVFATAIFNFKLILDIANINNQLKDYCIFLALITWCKFKILVGNKEHHILLVKDFSKSNVAKQ